MHTLKRTRIVVADDHPVVRIGARAILEMHPETDVVAEAGTLDDLFTALHHEECDVLILCLRLTGTRMNSGVAAIAAVRRAFPRIKLIVYPDCYTPQTIRIAISLGALGVVSKHEIPMHLTSAVRSVAQGFRYVSSGIYQHTIGCNEVRRLTLDEELLLQLIADGNSLAEVAHILGESLPEARRRKHLAMEKLGIYTPVELYRFLATWRFDEGNSDSPPLEPAALKHR
jgi:Response regulator containing a CheY-like receiver domain and an HTH DNA-binding domain